MFAPLIIAVAVSANAEAIEMTVKLDLRVRVVEAIEGGPVIIETTLTNRSQSTIDVVLGGGEGESSVELPAIWNRPENVIDNTIGNTALFAFRPGETWTREHIVHNSANFQALKGQGKLIVRWPLNSRTDSPSLAVEIKLTPASPRVVCELATRVQEQLDRIPAPKAGESANYNALRGVADRVLNTPHPGLTSSILKILDRCTPGSKDDDTRYLRRMLIATMTSSDRDSHRSTVDRLMTTSPPFYAPDLFASWRFDFDRATLLVQGWYWISMCEDVYRRYDYASLPTCFGTRLVRELIDCQIVAQRLLQPEQIQTLTKAQDYWVRVLTYATFSDRVDPKWSSHLLMKIRDRFPPLSDTRVAPLIRDLDDADFKVRDTAERKLLSLGHGIARSLRVVADRGPTPESRQRAEKILDRLGREPLDSRASAVIKFLSHQPGAAKLLAALADGPESDPVAIAARKRQTELAPRP